MEEKIRQEILRYVMGATIVENQIEYEQKLAQMCNENGMDFNALLEDAKSKIPPKKNHTQLVQDIKENTNKTLDKELRKAFDMFKNSEGVNVRNFKMDNEKEPKSEKLYIQESRKNKNEMIRDLLIKIRQDYKGYDQINDLEGSNFLKKRQIKKIRKQELDKIFSIDLNKPEQLNKIGNEISWIREFYFKWK